MRLPLKSAVFLATESTKGDYDYLIRHYKGLITDKIGDGNFDDFIDTNVITDSSYRFDSFTFYFTDS